jgi:dTDP-4-dehydrorhamnose 3,5-epimerase
VRFEQGHLEGVMVVRPELKQDERGFFSRTFCSDEFAAAGIPFDTAQSNIAFSKKRGTLRGIHFELPPATQHKVVRCTRGSAYYVVIDLRPYSSTYLQHFGITLDDVARTILYVPPGFASACQSLSDNTELAYQMSDFYVPGREIGFRFDDPAFAIAWPLPVTVVSEKDLSWPAFQPDLALVTAVSD